MGTNSYVRRNYRGKTGREELFAPSPTPHMNRVNAKINEVKYKTPNVNKLATTIALTVVENKIPNVSNLFRKTDHKTKVIKIENKIATDHDLDNFITTYEFKKLSSENYCETKIRKFSKKKLYC